MARRRASISGSPQRSSRIMAAWLGHRSTPRVDLMTLAPARPSSCARASCAGSSNVVASCMPSCRAPSQSSAHLHGCQTPVLPRRADRSSPGLTLRNVGFVDQLPKLFVKGHRIVQKRAVRRDGNGAARGRNDGDIEQLAEFGRETHPLDHVAVADIDDRQAAPGSCPRGIVLGIVQLMILECTRIIASGENELPLY
jgi:hypothetical protein